MDGITAQKSSNLRRKKPLRQAQSNQDLPMMEAVAISSSNSAIDTLPETA